MTMPTWQPKLPIDAVIFDCDGTLTRLEGIDVLAEHNGVGHEVTELTAHAMSSTGVNPDMYQARLNMVKPTNEQVHALGLEYFANRVDDIAEVIQILKRLKKTLFIISAGLNPAVRIFGELLKVPEENIFAVDVAFNADGSYFDYDKDSPLVKRNGKRVIVSEIKKSYKNVAYLGDGINDLEARDLVERFIGYGGMFYRENIAVLCQYYICTPSMSALLPLALTPEEYESLDDAEKMLYEKGVVAIKANQVLQQA
jgi:phosphoserine phosphatase